MENEKWQHICQEKRVKKLEKYLFFVIFKVPSGVNKNDDQSDSSESESRDDTGVGGHTDHSYIPPSQTIFQPTKAVTEISTDVSKVIQ